MAPDDPGVLEAIGLVYVNVHRVEEGTRFLKRAGTRSAERALEEFNKKPLRNS